MLAFSSLDIERGDPFAARTHNFACAKLPLILALLGEGEVGAKNNGGKGKKKSTAIAVLLFLCS